VLFDRLTFFAVLVFAASAPVTFTGCSDHDSSDTASSAEVALDPLYDKALYALEKSCANPSSDVKQKCVEMLRGRAASCRVHIGAEDPRPLRTFISCVNPIPICGGHEIRNEDDMQKHCKTPTSPRD